MATKKTSASDEPKTMPEVPEGLDTAIFKNGWEAAQQPVPEGGSPPVNPFKPDTPQAKAWDAGFNA